MTPYFELNFLFLSQIFIYNIRVLGDTIRNSTRGWLSTSHASIRSPISDFTTVNFEFFNIFDWNLFQFLHSVWLQNHCHSPRVNIFFKLTLISASATSKNHFDHMHMGFSNRMCALNLSARNINSSFFFISIKIEPARNTFHCSKILFF